MELSKQDLSLIKEMADEFLLAIPEAEDVEALLKRVIEEYESRD